MSHGVFEHVLPDFIEEPLGCALYMIFFETDGSQTEKLQIQGGK